jgi:hypothetical protein
MINKEPDINKVKELMDKLEGVVANQHCKVCMGKGVKVWSPVPGVDLRYDRCGCLRRKDEVQHKAV